MKYHVIAKPDANKCIHPHLHSVFFEYFGHVTSFASDLRKPVGFQAVQELIVVLIVDFKGIC